MPYLYFLMNRCIFTGTFVISCEELDLDTFEVSSTCAGARVRVPSVWCTNSLSVRLSVSKSRVGMVHSILQSPVVIRNGPRTLTMGIRIHRFRIFGGGSWVGAHCPIAKYLLLAMRITKPDFLNDIYQWYVIFAVSVLKQVFRSLLHRVVFSKLL